MCLNLNIFEYVLLLCIHNNVIFVWKFICKCVYNNATATIN
jgi:hypothetical protein